MPIYIKDSIRKDMPGYKIIYNNKHNYEEMVHSTAIRELFDIRRNKELVHSS